jgi:hypothetical protein
MAANRSVYRSWQGGWSAKAASAGLLREILPPADAAAAQVPPPHSQSQTVTGTARYRPEAVTCGD